MCALERREVVICGRYIDSSVAYQGYGRELVERVPLETPAGPDNRAYLETKKNKLGHLLESL